MLDNNNLVIDTRVAVVATTNFFAAGIPDVGKVVSRHCVFKELYWLTFSNPEKATKLFTEKILKAFSNYLSEYIPSDKAAYKSPFKAAAYSAEYGTDIVVVADNDAYTVAKRAIAIDPKDMESIRKFAYDMDFLARLFAEKSIDAAKKLVQVDCEYIEFLGSPLMSRHLNNENFNVVVDDRLDDDNHKESVGSVDEFLAKTEINGKIVTTNMVDDDDTHVHDNLFDLALDQLDDIKSFAVKLSGYTQAMPAEVMEYCDAVANTKSGCRTTALFRMVIQQFRTLNSNRTQQFGKIREYLREYAYSYSRRELENIFKDIKEVVEKNEFGPIFEAMTDMLRRVSFHMSHVERAAIMMSLINGAGDGSGSKIMYRLLPEEYVLWVVEMSRKFGCWEVADYVEERLNEVSGFEDGEVAEFICGSANEEDKHAFSDEDLDGYWMICETEDGFVARKPIEDFIKIDEPEDTVVFQTKEAPLTMLRNIKIGDKIQLGAADTGWNYIVNGMKNGKWDNWVSTADYKACGNENIKIKFYDKYNTGIVRHVLINEYSDKFRAMVVLEDAHHADIAVAGSNAVAPKPVQQAPKQSEFMSKIAACKVEVKKAEVAAAPKKAEASMPSFMRNAKIVKGCASEPVKQAKKAVDKLPKVSKLDSAIAELLAL